jgi:DNA polymerase I
VPRSQPREASSGATSAASDPRPLLLLLDGHSLAYRAFFALPDTLRTSSGELTNAVHGFVSMLVRLLVERAPAAIAVAFDVGEDEERTAAYEDYKAGRDEMPDELATQIDRLHEVLAALGIATVEVQGIEADDVLATMATNAVGDGYRVEIVTGDRDAMQLVDDDVTVLYTLKGISEVAEMTPAAVQERFGVPPDRYVQLAALRGDGSDNLPGVPGVGAKTAAKLLTDFGGIEDVYARIDEVAGRKVPEMLVEHRAAVDRNLALMTLRRDVALDVGTADLVRSQVDREGLEALFVELELRTIGARVRKELLGEDGSPPSGAPSSAPSVVDPSADRAEDGASGGGVSDHGEEHVADVASPVLLDAVALEAWLATATGVVALVVESDGRPPEVRTRRVGLAASGLPPAVVPEELCRPGASSGFDALLADPQRRLVVHDAKLLHQALGVDGRVIDGVALDSLLAGYLLAPELRDHQLAPLVALHLGRDAAGGAGEDREGRLDLDVDGDAWASVAHAAADLLELAPVLERTLDERDQRALHDDIELPLAVVLARIEDAGIAIDVDVLSELRGELGGRVEELAAEVHRHAGREFNVASSQQLQVVLFEELGLPRTRRTKTGHSTDAAALADLAVDYPIVGAVLEWREVSKLLSTYVDALPPLVNARTGRIHTTLSQTIAATGRLSSSHPNLQNIPVRRPEGRAVRRAFVTGEGYATLLVADYSQIELRILAHLSEDHGLLEAFAAGEDVHATTAARLFDVELEAVDSTTRDRAKAVNYGLAYGLTAFGLARQLGIPGDEAQAIVDAYDERFPGVRTYLDDVVARAARDGYTTTLYGRRRHLPDLTSSDRNRRQIAERMALNAPIQGTAADVIKLAMIALDRALADAAVRSRQILQVHDEVIVEVAPGEEDEVRTLTVEALSGVADLRVPLEVDTAFGRTWFDAQKH